MSSAARRDSSWAQPSAPSTSPPPSPHREPTRSGDRSLNFAAWAAQGEVAFRTDPGNDEALLLHNQFMNSPGHRKIILNPRWDEVGIGFCARNGFWVTQRFAP
jgi:hypothetical protein